MDLKADNVMYQACNTCNKKVEELDDGRFRLEFCYESEPPTYLFTLLQRSSIIELTQKIMNANCPFNFQ